MKVYLYIKRHSITGMLYFGKTTKNPYSYSGSGKYWKRHLQKHGNSVETLDVWEFDDELSAERFAIEFSLVNDIVLSPNWANLVVENGKDGAPVGHKGHVFSEDQKLRFSEKSKQRWADPLYRQKVVDSHRKTYHNGREVVLPEWTEERKREHSDRLKQIFLENPETYRRFIESTKLPKSESHKLSISESLKGLSKSEDHKKSLAWSRIIKYNPDVDATDYDDFVRKCLELYSDNGNMSETARSLNVGWGAVNSVISNEYLLKEK